MKGIPPEIDSLLWAVAEDESPRAGDEFVARYPKYAGELARRRQLVQGLRGVRPRETAPPKPRPAFRPAPSRPPVPKRTLVVVGGLVLAAIAVASYTVASLASPPPPAPKTTPIVEYRPPAAVETPKIESPPPIQVPPPIKQEQPQPESPVATGEKPQTFKVKGADLANSLTILGAEAGVKIVVAPGMSKQAIDADYEDMPLSEILEDLGRRYGFTPFDQGDGTIIVVPAVDPSRQDAPSGTVPGGDGQLDRHQLDRRDR